MTITNKRIDFFKAEAGLDFNSIDTMDDNELLKTIRLSKKSYKKRTTMWFFLIILFLLHISHVYCNMHIQLLLFLYLSN